MTIGVTYTLCFVTRGDEILLLNRNKGPNMGLWNGLGGKIEAGETPEENVRREVWEEAGLQLGVIRFAGLLTWSEDGEDRGGICLYTAAIETGRSVPRVTDTPEGILAWKPLAWVLHPANLGVVSNLPHILPVLFAQTECCWFHCCYQNGILVELTQRPIGDLQNITASI